MGVGVADLNLADKGLVLIQGENKDDPSANSNGSAKSSMVDALLWCLYGDTARGLTGDDVVNRHAGKGCKVTVELEDGPQKYTIERWRKIKLNGKMSGVSAVEHLSPAHASILTRGTDKLTQVEIDRILGCSKDVFCAAIYSAQEAMPDLPSMTDKPLKMMIEEAAGITILERASEVARKRLSTAEAHLGLCEDKTKNAKAAYDRQAHHVDDLNEQEVSWGADQADRIKEADARTLAVLEEAKRISAEIKAGKTKEAFQAEIDALTPSIEECGRAIAATRQEGEKLSVYTKAVTDAERKQAVAEAELRSACTRYKEANAHFEHLNTAGPQACGECGRELEGVDKSEAIKIAGDKLGMAGVVVNTMKKAVEAAKVAVATAKTSADAYRAGMTDVTAELARQDTFLKASRKLKDEQHARDLKVTALDDKKRQVVTLNARKKELEGESNPFTALLAEATTKLAGLKLALDTCERDELDAYGKVKTMQAVVSVYGPKGVRAHIIDTVTPFLNDRTAHYLGALSDGKIEAVWSTISFNKSGDMAEKFAIAVEKDGGGSFKALSGGEKKKVRLACALALQDLVASRASKPIDLWVGDEIDEALDASGLERLMNVLENKARERGTVLVISHHDLKDWVRQVQTVTMEKGKALTEGVLDA